MNDEENLESIPLPEEKDSGIVPVDSSPGGRTARFVAVEDTVFS